MISSVLELTPTFRLIAVIEKIPDETAAVELSVPLEMLVTVLTTVVALEIDVTPVVEATVVRAVAGMLDEDDIIVDVYMFVADKVVASVEV